jgi:hypothetical protein
MLIVVHSQIVCASLQSFINLPNHSFILVVTHKFPRLRMFIMQKQTLTFTMQMQTQTLILKHKHKCKYSCSNVNANTHAHNVNVDVHNSDINAHGHNTNVDVHAHSPSFNTHIHSLLIITDHSLIEAKTSQINHISHKSRSHKSCNSRKCTKTWKLEVIKLTYHETWKFKDLIHGYLNLLYHLLLGSDQQPSTTFYEWWAIYDEQTILRIHLPYMDNCGSTSISSPKAFKFNNEYIAQLYCWGFTKSTI